MKFYFCHVVVCVGLRVDHLRRKGNVRERLKLALPLVINFHLHAFSS